MNANHKARSGTLHEPYKHGGLVLPGYINNIVQVPARLEVGSEDGQAQVVWFNHLAHMVQQLGYFIVPTETLECAGMLCYAQQIWRRTIGDTLWDSVKTFELASGHGTIDPGFNQIRRCNLELSGVPDTGYTTMGNTPFIQGGYISFTHAVGDEEHQRLDTVKCCRYPRNTGAKLLNYYLPPGVTMSGTLYCSKYPDEGTMNSATLIYNPETSETDGIGPGAGFADYPVGWEPIYQTVPALQPQGGIGEFQCPPQYGLTGQLKYSKLWHASKVLQSYLGQAWERICAYEYGNQTDGLLNVKGEYTYLCAPRNVRSFGGDITVQVEQSNFNYGTEGLKYYGRYAFKYDNYYGPVHNIDSDSITAFPEYLKCTGVLIHLKPGCTLNGAVVTSDVQATPMRINEQTIDFLTGKLGPFSDS